MPKLKVGNEYKLKNGDIVKVYDVIISDRFKIFMAGMKDCYRILYFHKDGVPVNNKDGILDHYQITHEIRPDFKQWEKGTRVIYHIDNHRYFAGVSINGKPMIWPDGKDEWTSKVPPLEVEPEHLSLAEY